MILRFDDVPRSKVYGESQIQKFGDNNVVRTLRSCSGWS